MLGIADDYTAYCVDEAAALLVGAVDSGRKPEYLKMHDHMSSVRASLERIRKRKKK